MPVDRQLWIVFGDGGMASFRDTRLDAKRNVRIFELRPTQWTRYQHQIEDDEYDPMTGYIVKEFPAHYCIQLSAGPNINTWLILCDWNGKETELMNHINKTLLIRLENAIREKNAYKKEVFRLLQLLKTSVQHPNQLEKNIMDRLSNMKKIVGTTIEAKPPPPPTEIGEEL